MSSIPPPRSSGPIFDQLLYVSDSVSGASSGLEMSDILDEARPANARDHVTGALTAVDGRFVQVIEGSTSALDGLLARLHRDRRHTRLKVLARRPISDRAFADWDMISPRLAQAEMRTLATLLAGDCATLDAVITIMTAAIARQEAVIESGRQPATSPATTMGKSTGPSSTGTKA